jgi:hypothetical protein
MPHPPSRRQPADSADRHPAQDLGSRGAPGERERRSPWTPTVHHGELHAPTAGDEQAPNGEFGRHAATRDSGAPDSSGFHRVWWLRRSAAPKLCWAPDALAGGRSGARAARAARRTPRGGARQDARPEEGAVQRAVAPAGARSIAAVYEESGQTLACPDEAGKDATPKVRIRRLRDATAQATDVPAGLVLTGGVGSPGGDGRAEVVRAR